MNKKILATAISSLLVAGVSAQAADVELSGQVSRVIVSPDDAGGDELQFLDNNISGSRFRVKAKHAIENGMTAGARIELQVQSNKGNNANGGTYTDTGGNLSGDDSIDLRYQDVYLSGDFGKVSLGKGDGAGNGAAEEDLSGTYIVASAGATDLYGGFLLDDTTRVGEVYGHVDAYSRVNRIRYDSNNYSGFSFAVSYGQQEVTELAARYSGGTDTRYKLAAYIGSRGERSQGADDGDERMGISGSVLLSGGLNFTASYSQLDSDLSTDEDRENMWLKVGYITGKHAFAIDYGETEDTDDSNSANDTDAETLGVSYVFTLVESVELFGGYREYTSDDVIGTNNTDVELITLGSRIKF